MGGDPFCFCRESEMLSDDEPPLLDPNTLGVALGSISDTESLPDVYDVALRQAFDVDDIFYRQSCCSRSRSRSPRVVVNVSAVEGAAGSPRVVAAESADQWGLMSSDSDDGSLAEERSPGVIVDVEGVGMQVQLSSTDESSCSSSSSSSSSSNGSDVEVAAEQSPFNHMPLIEAESAGQQLELSSSSDESSSSGDERPAEVQGVHLATVGPPATLGPDRLQSPPPVVPSVAASSSERLCDNDSSELLPEEMCGERWPPGTSWLKKPVRWPPGTSWWAERLWLILSALVSKFPYLLCMPPVAILLELQCAGTAGELLGLEVLILEF